MCLKVTAVNNEHEPLEMFMSYSQTPYNSNGDGAFNVSYELLSTIGLSLSQDVLVRVINQVYPLERIYVTPVTSEDWDLLVSFICRCLNKRNI